MDNTTITFEYKTKKHLFKIASIITFLKLEDVEFDYQLCLEACKDSCENYNKMYCCPPHSPPLNVIGKNYDYLVVHALKINHTTLKPVLNSIRIINTVAKCLQNKFFDCSCEEFKKLNYKIKILENGACNHCATCACQEGKPCKYPDKMNFSLESTGIDVNKLMVQSFDLPLKWFTREKGFPEYQTCTGAILTNEPEEIINTINEKIREFIEINDRLILVSPSLSVKT